MYKHTYKVKVKELIDFKLLEKKHLLLGLWKFEFYLLFFSFIICSIARSLRLFKKGYNQG